MRVLTRVVCLPIVRKPTSRSSLADSKTVTLCPDRAEDMAVASPLIPAPTMMMSNLTGDCCWTVGNSPGAGVGWYPFTVMVNASQVFLRRVKMLLEGVVKRPQSVGRTSGEGQWRVFQERAMLTVTVQVMGLFPDRTTWIPGSLIAMCRMCAGAAGLIRSSVRPEMPKLNGVVRMIRSHAPPPLMRSLGVCLLY